MEQLVEALGCQTNRALEATTAIVSVASGCYAMRWAERLRETNVIWQCS
jgi:hypothetical protein